MLIKREDGLSGPSSFYRFFMKRIYMVMLALLQAVIMGFAGLDFNPEGGIMQVKQHGIPKHWKKLVIKGVGPEKRTFVIESR